MKKTILTIIIPAYNEKDSLSFLLKNIIKKKLKKQIIIIDDKSNDGTRDIILKHKHNLDKIIFHKKNMGKGAAIKSAQKFIKGDVVIIQDADLEYDPSDYSKMMNFFKKDKLKVLYGSRVLNKKKFENYKNFSHSIRIWGNILLTKFSNLLNNQNLTDAHTCYKMFDAKLFKKIKLKEKGFSFCPEVTTKISKLRIPIQEIEINYKGRTYDQGKKIKAIDGLYAIMTILKYKFF